MAAKKIKPKRATVVRNRVVGQRTIRAGDLTAAQDHPLNWRTHGDEQARALDDLLGDIGFVKPVDVYIPDAADSFVTEGVTVEGELRKLIAGVPVIMDGHLRRKRLPPDFELILNVTDLSQAEACLYLATCDPVSALAGQDDARLSELLSGCESDSAAVQKMLSDLLDVGDEPEDGDESDDTGGEKFQILVTCSGEEQQRELISEFLDRSIDHKALLGS